MAGDTVRVGVVSAGDLPLPAYETADSAGVDLRAHLDAAIELAPGERALVPTGLRLEIPCLRASPERGLICASVPGGNAMERPVGTNCRPPGASPRGATE